MPSEPSRAQLSSRLAYNQTTPSFLVRLKARVAGEAEPEEDEPTYADEQDEWEDPGDGRPAIPRRPAIPERPKEGEWGSEKVGKGGDGAAAKRDVEEDGEENGDEAPQIVVLKEGKHLTAEDVENERRTAKGLPPLQKNTVEDDRNPPPTDPSSTSQPSKTSENRSMSFTSSKRTPAAGPSTKKRKVVGAEEEDVTMKASKPTKKPKSAKKALLSFEEEG